MHFDAHVAAPPYTRTAAATASAEQVAEVEPCALEDIAEMAEYIFHGHAASAEAAGALHSCHAELVITLSLLRVGKHLIRLCRLFEFLLSLLVARVLVRVILDGFLAVGFFYLFRTGVLLHAKHLIIISLLCHNFVLSFVHCTLSLCTLFAYYHFGEANHFLA